MISIKRIIEQAGMDGQYYDLGRDFANFKRTIDGAGEEIKKRYEHSIGTKLIGKRIRARASRGYKQYEKYYEFDVAKIMVDDPFENKYVVIAQDSTTPKPKEYFLKPGFKVQILGPATGQPSPQKGDKPGDQKPAQAQKPVAPPPVPDKAQTQMALAPVGATSAEPVKEEQSGFYDAYSIEEISKDIEKWLPERLKKPESVMRDFVKTLGWKKNLGQGTTVAMYDLKVPAESLAKQLSQEGLQKRFTMEGQQPTGAKYQVVKMNFDEAKEEWNIRIKKTMTDPTSV